MAEEAKSTAAGTGSQELAPAKGTIRDLMERNKQAIVRALPKGVEPDRFWQIAWTAVRRNPRLQSAEPQSLLGAIIEAAQAGLSLDPAMRQADLVPFWNSRKNCTEVQFMPRYGGYIEQAHRSGKVSNIFARVVYENEPFKIMQGLRTKIVHLPKPPSERGEKKRGCYAVCVMKDGTEQAEWMWADEIIEVRNRSFRGKRIDTEKPSDKWGAWATDEDEMFKKTAIRRLAKVIPLSSEWTMMATRDEYRDAGIAQPTDIEIEAQHDAAMAEFSAPQEIPEKAEQTRGPEDAGKKDPPGEKAVGIDAVVEGENGKKVDVPENAARKIMQSGKMDNRNNELGSITEKETKKVNVMLDSLGHKTRDERHGALAKMLGTKIQSVKELSSAEAGAVIEIMEEVLKAQGSQKGE